MAIKRARRKTNFTIISNVGLRDEKLSLKAKGLLAYMLSLPDDWIFYETEIVKHCTDGKQSVRTGLKELQKNGYLLKEQERNRKGKFSKVDWVVYDEPENAVIPKFSPSTDYPSTGKPSTDNPSAGKPSTGNQPLLSTNGTKDLPIPSTNKTKDKKNAPKHKYGEFDNVLLTDEEKGKLKERFPTDLDKRIENLSGYIASTGKAYKSHYATIINWAKKDKQKVTGGGQESVSEYDNIF